MLKKRKLSRIYNTSWNQVPFQKAKETTKTLQSLSDRTLNISSLSMSHVRLFAGELHWFALRRGGAPPPPATGKKSLVH